MVFGRKKVVEVKVEKPVETKVENVHIGTSTEPVKEVSAEEHMAFLVETVSGMTDSEYKAQVLSLLLELLEDGNNGRKN